MDLGEMRIFAEELKKEFGCADLVNLDGGGSSQMIRRTGPCEDIEHVYCQEQDRPVPYTLMVMHKDYPAPNHEGETWQKEIKN